MSDEQFSALLAEIKTSRKEIEKTVQHVYVCIMIAMLVWFVILAKICRE